MRILLLLLMAALALPAGAGAQRNPHAPGATLPAFRSEAEMARFLAEHGRERERRALEWRDSAAARTARCGRAEVSAAAEDSSAPGGPAPGVISGQVLDMAGRPLRHVMVYAAGMPVRTMAAEDGRYRLEVPADRLSGSTRLTVTASRIGLGTVSASVPLAPGGSAHATFRLCVSLLGVSGGVPPEGTFLPHEPADTGGMVEVHGEHLVILRHGRLFTVRIGARDPRPVSMVDAFAPGNEPKEAYHDQLLVSGNVVIVVGRSNAGPDGEEGPEVGLFRIDAAGRLRHASTYQMRGAGEERLWPGDVRLANGKLVFYTPIVLSPVEEDGLSRQLPSIRRWHRGATEAEFRPIPATGRLHRPARPLDPDASLELHTLLVCDVARAELNCAATAVPAPGMGSVFHVSPRAVFVWTTGWRRSTESPAPVVVYRLPLDGSAPSALGAAGSPLDFRSFLESGDGHLNVLVRAAGAGMRLWEWERAGGGAALLRVPLASFGDGSAEAPESAYRPLPAPAAGALRNRFVGRHLLYGVGSDRGKPLAGGTGLHVVEWAGGPASLLPLPHGVDEIHAMGADAVVSGADERDLHFTAVRLSGRPAPAGRHVLRGALCSNGVFHRADGGGTGLVALPVQGPCSPGYHGRETPWRAVVFLRERAGELEEMGTLEARTDGAADDRCGAGCFDWTGSARPLFFRGRVFAILGYELLEGEVIDGRIREVRRTAFGPGS